MTEYILKRWTRFDNFVALFTIKLGKPARRHLVALLIALIIWDGRKNIAGLNRALFAPCHHSSVFRFIGEGNWQPDEFDAIRQHELNRRLRRYLDSQTARAQKVPALLCIDDTNNPKSGKHTPWASYQYNHSTATKLRCWCLVTALMVVGPYQVPFAFRLYRRQEDCVAAGQPGRFRSKIELACQLIADWQPPAGTQPFVLVDSWYVSDPLLQVCAKHGFTLIGGIKANRQITTAKCSDLTALSALAPQLPTDAYQTVTQGRLRFQLVALEATFKTGQRVKLLVSRAFKRGANPKAGIKQYVYRYFVSTDTRLSVQTICELYAVRWEIETYHAHLKELLGCDQNQCWRERNVERLWSLVLIAYSYLLLEAVEGEADYLPSNARKLRSGIGEVVAAHKQSAHQAWAEWIYHQSQAGQTLEQILAQIAA